jgi:hypothetical protein
MATFGSNGHSPPKEGADLSNEWLIQQLEIERRHFERSPSELTPKQRKDFRVWHELLSESPTSLASRSKERKSKRLRARALLSSVFLELGPKVFLLCTLATSFSKLAEKPRPNLNQDLGLWWSTVPRLTGLTQIATDICKANSIDTFIAPTPQKLPIANKGGMQNLSHIS